MFQYIGGDVVGMTNVPEVTLAREAGICYATVATVTNWAAGISSARLTHEEVLDVVTANVENIRELIFHVIESLEDDRACDCCGAPDPVEV
jgi:5'-methylthioadenosine phosphorylase